MEPSFPEPQVCHKRRKPNIIFASVSYLQDAVGFLSSNRLETGLSPAVTVTVWKVPLPQPACDPVTMDGDPTGWIRSNPSEKKCRRFGVYHSSVVTQSRQQPLRVDLRHQRLTSQQTLLRPPVSSPLLRGGGPRSGGGALDVPQTPAMREEPLRLSAALRATSP